MAQLIIATAGAAIGGAIGGPLGASVGWALGSAVGAQFGPKQRTQGPRLEDLKVAGVEYGQPIPWGAGHPRVAGQVWWASDRREISTTTTVGKGGGAESTSYTYEVDILYGLLDREIDYVARIWLNGKLVWTAHVDSDLDSITNSIEVSEWRRLTVYTGAATQLPDPTYEAAVGNAPAYRGRGTVFIEGLQLGNSGVIPNLTFEVVVDGTLTYVDKGFLCQWDSMTNATDVDATLGPDPVLSNGAALDTGVKKFGSSALKVGQTSIARARTASTIVQEVYLGKSWRFEFWAYFTGDSSNAVELGNPASISIGKGGAFSAYNYNLICQQFQSGGGLGGPSLAPPLNTWVHVAVEQVAGQRIKVYDSHTGLIGELDSGQPVPTFSAAAFSRVNIENGTTPLYVDSMLFRWFEDDEQDDLYAVGGYSVPTGPFTPPPYAYTVVDPAEDTIRNVVEDLCERAGLPAGAYDAAALASITKPVRAMAVGQVTPARAVLEQLMAGYYFEAYNTDKLYFVPRAGSSLATLTADDMGYGFDAPDVDVLPMQVGSDEEVPAQVAVSYANVDADYNTATEFSDRLVSGQVNVAPMQLPLAFTAAEAKGIADATLVDGYAARVSGRLALPVAYARLVPTDVVTAPAADGTLYRLRLVRRTDTTPLLEYEWVLDDATAVVSAGITSGDYAPTISVALPGDTLMQLLDCPLLQDTEDQLGHYVAATSRGSTWPGASINRSVDDVDYAEVARVGERAVIGIATTVLPTWTGGQVFDETSTVTVNVATTLSSSTRDAMLADVSVNAMLIGSELVRYRTATLVSTGIYTLSGLLRGQKGTEWAMGTHAANESVVLLRTAGLRYVPIDSASLGIARYYKGVTVGRTLAGVAGTAFTFNGVSSKPLAPVDLRASGSASTGLTLTWKRRTRLSSSFTGPAGAVVPLGEALERYEVDLLNGSSVVVSTVSTSTPNAAFYGAQQSKYLPLGVKFVQLDGSDYVGVTTEGASYAWRYLVRQTAAGVETARLYLGEAVDDLLVAGGYVYARIQEIDNSSTPAFTTKTALYRIALADIAAGYTHQYVCTSTGDYGQIAYDGSSLWISEPDSAKLVKLNAATLAVTTNYSLPGKAPGALCFDSTTGDLFWADSAGFVYELVRWNIAGTSETWRVSSTARISWMRVHGSLLFACCADGQLRVFNVSTGALVTSHTGTDYGPQQFPLLAGEAVAYLNVPGLGVCVNTFSTSTGALSKRFTVARGLGFGGVTGSDIWTYFATTDYTNHDSAAYTVAASFSGYTARVYQLSASVGRGYAASINL